MYPVTGRTTPHRLAERVSYDRAAAYAILDEAYVCHLAFEGPRVLPTLHVRIGDTLYVHGSTGSGPLLALADGGPVCVAVTLIDALVLARSQFHHSANYRSVVMHGVATPVVDEPTRRKVLAALVDKVAPGRSAETRPPTAKELAGSGVLAIPLVEVSVKARDNDVVDDPADLTLPYWAGIVPLRLAEGRPEPDRDVAVPVPGYLVPERSPWLEPVVLEGKYVRLEPLDQCHAADLFAALDDEEVHRYIPAPQPRSVEDMADAIRVKLDEAGAGRRVAWVLKTPTGEVVGTTSYCPVDEYSRTIHIGSTQVGRAWWRTGVNSEAKLLLMTRAFEDLGAVRVEWQVDNLNVRSQRAVERLGATREGVLRKHRRRADGTQRDSVFFGMTDDEWPAARKALVDRIARG